MSSDDLAKRLFEAARSERAPKQLRRRILEGEDARPRVASAAPATGFRWRLVGTLAAIVALGLAFVVVSNTTPARDPSIAAEPFVPAPAREKPVSERPHQKEPTPTAPTGSAETRELPRSAPAPAKTPPRALPEQLALLKQARSELRAGNGARALELLAEYQRRPNRVDMSAEATLLRIEALASVGQREQAAMLAERFVAAHPNSPLSDRARSFVRRSPRVGTTHPEDSRNDEAKDILDGDGKQPNGRVDDEN